MIFEVPYRNSMNYPKIITKSTQPNLKIAFGFDRVPLGFAPSAGSQNAPVAVLPRFATVKLRAAQLYW